MATRLVSVPVGGAGLACSRQPTGTGVNPPRDSSSNRPHRDRTNRGQEEVFPDGDSEQRNPDQRACGSEMPVQVGAPFHCNPDLTASRCATRD